MRQRQTNSIGNYQPPRSVGVMAKFWFFGTVKTRLASGTSDHIAAEVHKRFTLHLVKQLTALAARRYVFVSPDHACSELQSAIGSGWTALPQGEGDLGNRMSLAFQFLLGQTEQPSAAILLGADLPTLTPGNIDTAFDKLSTADLVLGPAIDGGYYLIGLRGPWRRDYERLFESIPWSTDQVFAQTISVAHEMGLRNSLLDRREDVDHLDSLQRMLLSDSIDRGLKESILALLNKP